MLPAKAVRIEGLFGKYNIDVNLHGRVLVFVAPNGVGKSTILSVVYYIFSFQWSRLSQIRFDRIVVDVSETSFFLERSDIEFFVASSKDRSRGRPLDFYVDRLRQADLLESFLSDRNLKINISRYSNALRMTPSAITSLHRDITRELGSQLFKSSVIEFQEAVSRAEPYYILYFPTYRRIEKDIVNVFPSVADIFDRSSERTPLLEGRSGPNFAEIVNFGMDDVKRILRTEASRLRDFSRTQLNALTGRYLRDVIRQKATEVDIARIRSIDEDRIAEVLQLVDEGGLSAEDKSVIQTVILGIKSHGVGRLPLYQKYMAHYFIQLLNIDEQMKSEASNIRGFAAILDKYFRPDKKSEYDPQNYNLRIADELDQDLDFSDLSSGEKQIVSIFGHLLLGNYSQNNVVVIVDEPELSLSVPWQLNILDDIYETRRCSSVIAVTHSPFVYQQSGFARTVDLKDVIEVRGGQL